MGPAARPRLIGLPAPPAAAAPPLFKDTARAQGALLDLLAAAPLGQGHPHSMRYEKGVKRYPQIWTSRS